MPSPRKTRASRSRSPARGASPARTTRSKSPSRSRSRGRSKSPGRPAKAKQSPSPSRKSPSRQQVKKKVSPPPSPAPQEIKKETPAPSPSRTTAVKRTTPPRVPKTPSTPTRQSARLQELQEKEAEGPKQDDRTDRRAGSQEIPRFSASKYEFGGPIAVLLGILCLPALVIYLFLACNKDSCSLKKLPSLPRSLDAYFNLKAAGIFLGWVLFQALLAVLPIGRLVKGQPLKSSGKPLLYRCNGFIAMQISLVAFGVLAYLKYPVIFVYQHYLQLATTSIVFSFLVSIYLAVRARKIRQSAASPGGNTGNAIYDFWVGKELNPRIGSLDLKFFCELRPGLIGWVILNLCFVAQACKETQTPSPTLVLVVAMQSIYVADALWFEPAILSTMDITHEGFGFMLAFGDLTWVPFTYCLQTRFLLENPQAWGYPGLAGFTLLNLVGYIIFRGSNSQKDQFRKNPYDPALEHLESIPTPGGKRLLTSGWWGLSRHPNYLGDFIMALSWSLPCGFGSALPYFYVVYFAILLAHRAMRDDALCRQKHGPAWDRYCHKVKYRIIPYVY